MKIKLLIKSTWTFDKDYDKNIAKKCLLRTRI